MKENDWGKPYQKKTINGLNTQNRTDKDKETLKNSRSVQYRKATCHRGVKSSEVHKQYLQIRISATNGCSHRCCRHCCNDSRLQLLLENHFCLMYELFMQHCCNGRISANTEDKQQKQMPQTYNLAATKKTMQAQRSFYMHVLQTECGERAAIMNDVVIIAVSLKLQF